ncbi:MAG TPA: polyphosphate:AMP phosphotransferase [Methanoregulaceae archaeon]|nr:polyphosphate:AMP phosphotransferase [Methanoregulaceae archaeon]HQJ87332.1 polyphosphate:AMP phosphotransferase [Methanoregulaceae archaeon]
MNSTVTRDRNSERRKHLGIELGVQQRALRDRGIPVIIVVEGWNASGISDTVAALLDGLDPRGFDFHAFGHPSEEERDHTFLWRFWIRTPSRGRIAVFARSWYSRLLAEELHGIDGLERINRAIRSVRTFEQQLADAGTLVLKYFLQISREEQRRRLLARERDTLTSWLITRNDWDFHRQYDAYAPLIRRIIAETDTPDNPWRIVEADDSTRAVTEVLSSVVDRLRDRLALEGVCRLPIALPAVEMPPPVDTAKGPHTMGRQEYDAALVDSQARLRACQYSLFKRMIPLVIVYEGWDAAGKGGSIKRLVQSMNPRGYEVVPVSRPNDDELAHHYLWRFYRRFPPAGEVRIFDRSWYGRVLVERVEGFATEQEWKRAYSEINEMERTFVESGGGIIKFWLEIDRETQLRRFRERAQDPLKQWKITEEDWRNREKWDQYDAAVREMLARTSTPQAPWTVIDSRNKPYARLRAQRTVIEYVEGLI